MANNIPDKLLLIEELYMNSPYRVIHCKVEEDELIIVNIHGLNDLIPVGKKHHKIKIHDVFSMLMPIPEDRELIELSQTAQSWIEKILYTQRDGTRKYYEALIFSPVKGYITFLCRDITEHYEKESKIELQDATMRNILDHSRDIQFCISYLSNKIEYISPAVKDILGYESTQFQDKNPDEFYHLLHPEDEGVYKNFWKEIPVLEEQQVYFFKSEFRFKHDSGKYIWLSQFHNLISRAGKPHYLICSLRDISDIKESESALKESEERYSYAFDAANDGLWDYSLSDNKIFLSDSWYRMMGYEQKDIGNSVESLLELVHPDDKKLVIDREKEFTHSQEETYSINFRMLHASKEYRWIAAKGKKVQIDDKGKPLRLVGIHTDISERINAQEVLQGKNRELEEIEKELKEKNKELIKVNEEFENRNKELESAYNKLAENELILRQFTENIGDVFWIQSHHDILYVNAAFENVWGMKREEVLLNAGILNEYIYEEDKGKFDFFSGFKILKKTSSYTEQFRIVKSDGNLRWIWFRLFPIYDENNQIKQAAAIASDITQQKEFESTLKLAKDQAQESDRLKSTFLANISHEIRTPMNGIIGFADLLTQRDLEENIRVNYLNIIKKSSEQLVRIIDDIVEYAKIESKQINLLSSSFDLNQLFRDINLSFLNYIKNTNLKLSLRMQLPPGSNEFNIVSDELRVRQILTNLIDNAIKYTEDGYVEYGYEKRADDILIYVKDTGIGIKDEIKEFIFHRFRQGDEGHTRKYGGTGLGLSICKGLTDLLKGEIWLESKVGNGTVFYFTIPVINNVISDRSETAADVDEEEIYDWNGKRILIVEDDHLNYEFLFSVIEETNAEISRAVEGSEAVRMCSSQSYDIILMDIRLPVLNGLEATRKIREMGIKTPIIAQTAYSLDDDREKSIESGCDDYIAKPITRKILLMKIDKLLKPSVK